MAHVHVANMKRPSSHAALPPKISHNYLYPYTAPSNSTIDLSQALAGNCSSLVSPADQLWNLPHFHTLLFSPTTPLSFPRFLVLRGKLTHRLPFPLLRRMHPVLVDFSLVAVDCSCRSILSGRASHLKSSQQIVLGEIKPKFGESYKMSSVVFAAGYGEQSVAVEDEASREMGVPSLNVFPGQAHPLGVLEVEKGINFAIFSQNATAITLCLLLEEREQHNKFDDEVIELPLDPQLNKTGDIWHICVEGTPMMLMGDEYGHTRYGNNNSYGHDNALNNFQWGQLNDKKGNHFRFFSEIIKFRRSHHVFAKENFIGKNEVTWHEDNWENYESKFLAFTFHEENGGDIYVAFNAHDYFVEASIPSPPQNRRWHRVVDTNLESQRDIVSEGVEGVKKIYKVAPYSCIILEAKP